MKAFKPLDPWTVVTTDALLPEIPSNCDYNEHPGYC